MQTYPYNNVLKILLVIVISGGFFGSVEAGDFDELRELEEQNHRNYKKMKKATVAITCNVPEGKPREGPYYGTGVVISRKGHILTTTSVVPAAAKLVNVIFSDGQKEEATIIGASLRYDLTLLKVSSDEHDFLQFSQKDQLQVGEQVYTGGNAFRTLHTQKKLNFSTGIISGVYDTRSVYWQSPYSGVAVESDAAINPGTDGGPLISNDGKLLGIITLATDRARFLGMATPVYLFTSFVNTLLANDRKNPTKKKNPYLGFTIDFDENPPLVEQVEREGPAWIAGVEEGDRILSVRDHKLNVDDMSERKDIFDQQYSQIHPRESLYMIIRRDGQRWSVLIPVGKQPL